MTREEIEKAAISSADANAIGPNHRIAYRDGFIAGDAHGYQRAVSEAAKDFPGHYEAVRDRGSKCLPHGAMAFGNEVLWETWNAARLSCAKKCVAKKYDAMADADVFFKERIAELERQLAELERQLAGQMAGRGK